MRLRILELPLKNTGADFTFALVVDEIGEQGEDFIDAVRVFGEQIGAAGVLVTDGQIDLPGADPIEVETEMVAGEIAIETDDGDDEDLVPGYAA